MTNIILFIHVTVCILLILIVLLQTGKGASMGASFGGGGSQALFGGAGPATMLNKLTTGVAIVFMLTSLSLAYMSGHKSQASIMSGVKAPIEQSAGNETSK